MTKIRNLIFRRQKGIGLLELMLSLAIIAILLVMATRYYLTTSQSQKVNEMIGLFNSLQSACAKWIPNNSDYTELDAATIIKNGWVPAKYESGDNITSPWGTDLTITGENNKAGAPDLKVIVDTKDAKTANDLATRLTGSSTSGVKGTSFTYYVVSQTSS